MQSFYVHSANIRLLYAEAGFSASLCSPILDLPDFISFFSGDETAHSLCHHHTEPREDWDASVLSRFKSESLFVDNLSYSSSSSPADPPTATPLPIDSNPSIPRMNDTSDMISSAFSDDEHFLTSFYFDHSNHGVGINLGICLAAVVYLAVIFTTLWYSGCSRDEKFLSNHSPPETKISRNEPKQPLVVGN